MKQLHEGIRRYCRGKGYVEGHGVNNFAPHDCVAAFQMAKLLTEGGLFDNYVAVAPEGHVYGFFFELLGAEVLEIFVNYPPTRVKEIDDLSSIVGLNVLLIEDDVVSGETLSMAMDTLLKYSPLSVSLYLGHMKSVQCLDNVPRGILKTYLAEDYLVPKRLWQYIEDLKSCWSNRCKTIDDEARKEDNGYKSS